jgi:DNA-binding MarR family transcriptional regulator
MNGPRSATGHSIRGIIASMPRADSTAESYELDPVLDFMRLLWSVEHGLERMSKRMGSELGITGPQRLVLRLIGRFPGISAGDLARVVRLHPSTLTGILQRLASRGLIERHSDPADSRRAQLHLKPSASWFTKSSRLTVEKVVTGALESSGPLNVRGARRVLTELAQRLNDL